MHRYPSRSAGMLLTIVTIELTIATAWIHLSLGGSLFTLNAVGYLGLATAYAAAASLPMASVQRFRWLPRLALAGFALITIGAYLVIGPYSPLGWATKAIEVAIVGLATAETLSAYGNLSGLVQAAMGSMRMGRGAMVEPSRRA